MPTNVRTGLHAIAVASWHLIPCLGPAWHMQDMHYADRDPLTECLKLTQKVLRHMEVGTCCACKLRASSHDACTVSQALSADVSEPHVQLLVQVCDISRFRMRQREKHVAQMLELEQLRARCTAMERELKQLHRITMKAR